MNFYAMNKDYKSAIDLSAQTILHSNLNDNISDHIKQTIISAEMNFNEKLSRPDNLIKNRVKAYDNMYYRYDSYLNGLEYYNFILSLEENFEKNPEDVVKKIKQVRMKAFNKSNLTVLFAGDSKVQKQFKTDLNEFIEELPDKKYKKASYDLPKPLKREAIIIDSDAQYIAVNTDIKNNSNGKFKVLSTILNDRYLIPQLRFNGGAYDIEGKIDDKSYNINIWRDINYNNSLDVLSKMNKYDLKNIDDNILDNYKIASLAAEDMSEGEITGAYNALKNEIEGVSESDKSEIFNEIKSVSADDIKKMNGRINGLNNDSNYIVAASFKDIEKHKEKFDKIIKIN